MAVTPIYSIPYVESSDLVANYPGVSESLAEQVEDKLPTYAATAPTSPSVGQIWIDSGDDTPNFWDGAAWVPFPSGVAAAVVSNTPTGTYTDGTGQAWEYHTFDASGTLTCTTVGEAQILIVSGGGGAGVSGGFVGGAGGGGAVTTNTVNLEAVAYTVTVGAGGGASARGGFSGFKPASGFDSPRLGIFGGSGGAPSAGVGGSDGSSGGGGSNNSGGTGAFNNAYGGNGQSAVSGGAGGNATANNLAGIGPGIENDYTGTSITYGRGNYFTGYTPTANRGEGGIASGGSGTSGRVVVRIKV